MRCRMISEVMPCFGYFFNFFRIFIYPITAHKKCCFYIIISKYLKKLICIISSPCRVE